MERLSSRGRRNVDVIMPRFPVAILEAKEDSDLVDLGAAENWVARDAMVELSREAINTKLEPKVSDYERFKQILLCSFFSSYASCIA